MSAIAFSRSAHSLLHSRRSFDYRGSLDSSPVGPSCGYSLPLCGSHGVLVSQDRIKRSIWKPVFHGLDRDMSEKSNAAFGYRKLLSARLLQGRHRQLTHSCLRAGFVRAPGEICDLNHNAKERLHDPPPAASAADFPVEADEALRDLSIISFLFSERAKVLFMVALAMALCNADRVVMSVAIVPLAAANNWSSSFAGVVQSSFLWGYLMSPIVGGMLADFYGGKIVMGYGVTLWSLATLLTPWAATHSLGMLLGMRVLLGFAEGVAMPCMNIMISRWFPATERVTAVGLSMAGFHLGSAAGLLATPLIISRYDLSGSFKAFGILGFIWLLIWATHIYKDPESSMQIKTSELSYIKQCDQSMAKLNMRPAAQITGQLPPFGLLLSKPPTWAIVVANSMNNWGYFILLSWMPVYFNTVFGVNLKEAAWFSALPWVIMAVVGFFAGTCSDFLIQSGFSITSVRKIMQSLGFLGPAITLFGLQGAKNASIAAICLSAAVGLSAFSQAGFLVNYQDIGPRYAGVLQGMSNTVGTMAAIASTIGTGYFIQWLGSFQAFLALTAILYIMSTLFWNFFATGERIFE
eukprot:c16771_g1_i1 orf=401-2134(-)